MQNSDNIMKFLKTAQDKLTIPSRPIVDKDQLKSLGIDEAPFTLSFNKLCEKWWDKAAILPDTVALRLVTRALTADILSPIILSIIADDVGAFKKNYNDALNDLFCFEFSCLAGSEHIINEIYLANNERKKCIVESVNAIAYSLSSGNTKLATLLASEYLKLGKTYPGELLLYSFGKLDCVASINKMFADKKSNKPSA